MSDEQNAHELKIEPERKRKKKTIRESQICESKMTGNCWADQLLLL